jgi:hypothetical protein
MYILEASDNATGDWFKVEIGGDYIISTRSGDDLGGGTLYIDVADGAQRTIASETDREISTLGAPLVVTLSRGMHVRGRLTGATGPTINLLAMSVEHAGGPALVAV